MLFRKESKLEPLMQVFIDWVTLLVPALAVWAILGVHSYRCEGYGVVVDTLYFLCMLGIAAMTWRTMSQNDACWLIHTASLGAMIVAGVMPKRETEETVHFVG